MEEEQKAQEQKPQKSLEGLGGWLILVGIGIIVSPLRIIGLTFPMYKEIFENGSWEVLTTPGTEVYNALWAPIMLSEMGINALIVLLWIYIAYLFFSKKKLLPKVYIGAMLFSVIFIIIDALAIQLVVPDEPIFDEATLKELFRAIVTTAIWVPYMMVSKRVKATFVK